MAATLRWNLMIRAMLSYIGLVDGVDKFGAAVRGALLSTAASPTRCLTYNLQLNCDTFHMQTMTARPSADSPISLTNWACGSDVGGQPGWNPAVADSGASSLRRRRRRSNGRFSVNSFIKLHTSSTPRGESDGWLFRRQQHFVLPAELRAAIQYLFPCISVFIMGRLRALLFWTTSLCLRGKAP